MADMPVLFHHRVLLRKTVHHAVILNVRAVFHHDPAKITAQAGVGADVNPFTEDHVANQHRGRVNIALFRHDRGQTINLINRHLPSSCDIQTTKALVVKRAGSGQFAHGGFPLLADKRKGTRRHALVDIYAQLSRVLPRPVRRE